MEITTPQVLVLVDRVEVQADPLEGLTAMVLEQPYKVLLVVYQSNILVAVEVVRVV